MSLTADDGTIARALRAAFAPDPPERVGVAVSGGSDSMALLFLMADWATAGGPEISAITINHGLRDEAAREADAVAEACARLNVAHDIRLWQGWDGGGNLQDQARRARQNLIGEWARDHGIGTVALGHTADDQAETVLMRLARAAGVDGLAAMRLSRVAGGIRWLRPLLDQRREALRAMLRRRGESWFDDPSNDNEDFERVRARMVLSQLEPLGLTVEALAATASRLASASDALARLTEEKARAMTIVSNGDVLIDRDRLLALPEEVQFRLLAHTLRWVSVAEYRPRQDAIGGLLQAIRDNRPHVLSGRHVLSGKTLRVTREFNAVAALTARPGEVWDRRWRIFGPLDQGYEVRALGETGLSNCPDWRDSGLPRVSLLASPAIWQGDRLLAAPLAGMANGWCAEHTRDNDDFFTALITH
ncbi:MAG: tRNA lysidine(34) synthetase TilS [Rhodobacteraceae bacterium]|nr:tRNA lysidine(34) synthetase TilS [Paracoccaceae bacterium]